MAQTSVPRFDPTTALGWADVGLDGLSCYLRCVEAVLAEHGRSATEIAVSLAAPLDLCGSRAEPGPRSHYPGCTVAWRLAPGGLPAEQIRNDLARGAYFVVSPNGRLWPGDEFEGSRDAHHHMVLPIDVDDRSRLTMLDIDADAESSFHRMLPLDDTCPSFDRWARVDVLPVPDGGLGTVASALVDASAGHIARDVAELAGLRQYWTGHPLPGLLARGLHVYVLGDVQPQLFLFATVLRLARRAELDPVADAAGRAARCAKKLGILLTGLHRFRSPSLYALCLDEMEQLETDLRRLADRLTGPAAAAVPATAPALLGRRLAAITEWSFGQPEHETLAWLSAPAAAPAMTTGL